jgi:hypothetical protein
METLVGESSAPTLLFTFFPYFFRFSICVRAGFALDFLCPLIRPWISLP